MSRVCSKYVCVNYVRKFARECEKEKNDGEGKCVHARIIRNGHRENRSSRSYLPCLTQDYLILRFVCITCNFALTVKQSRVTLNVGYEYGSMSL